MEDRNYVIFKASITRPFCTKKRIAVKPEPLNNGQAKPDQTKLNSNVH